MANNRNMPVNSVDSDGLLLDILRWAWVSFILVIAHIYRKLTGLEAKAEVVDVVNRHQEQLRKEDQARHEKSRDEMLDKVDRHHAIVMNKLDALEKRIKNGH